MFCLILSALSPLEEASEKSPVRRGRRTLTTTVCHSIGLQLRSSGLTVEEIIASLVQVLVLVLVLLLTEAGRFGARRRGGFINCIFHDSHRISLIKI